MAYKRFDDPSKAVNQAPYKVYEAFEHDEWRRAIMGITNRILSGSAGTGGTSLSNLNAAIGTGATCGVAVTGDWLISINGRVGTAAGQSNIYLPAGTQAASTYVKYLICLAFGTKGTIFAGNEGTGSTTAYLPNCPADYVPIGYVEYAANATAGFGRVGGGTANSQNILSGKTAGTDGTINVWVSLLHMPIWETGTSGKIE